MSTTDTGAMNPLPQLLFPDDLQFWYETLRWLGLAAYGGADFGEVVTTAQRITAGDISPAASAKQRTLAS